MEFVVEHGDDGRTKAVQVTGPAGAPPQGQPRREYDQGGYGGPLSCLTLHLGPAEPHPWSSRSGQHKAGLSANQSRSAARPAWVHGQTSLTHHTSAGGGGGSYGGGGGYGDGERL